MIRGPQSQGSPALRFAGCLLLLSCTLPACFKARSDEQEEKMLAAPCAIACHGDDKVAAPPVDLSGGTDEKSRGVGAHRKHLEASTTHAALPCETCHTVPATVEAPGHADTDRPAEVLMTGALATTGGKTPTYDAATLKCATSYCHGGPGKYPWPAEAVWNAPRSSDQACGSSCHSLPPGGSHPASDKCEMCHTDTAGPNHTIKNAALHVNGKIDVGAMGCTTCHGSDSNAAPPRDTSGNTDTTSIGVGAHQTHLAGGNFSKPVPCDTCHVVPDSVDAPGHMDSSLPAEVRFTGTAISGGSTPSWDRTKTSCSGSYCHPSTLGGANLAPSWTKADGSQVYCGSCHSLPPPLPHSQNDQCYICHDQTVDSSMTIINRQLHVDGTVEVKGGSCHACHGSSDNNAPPRSVSGSDQTTDVGVGAHQTHLKGGQWSRKVQCSECHKVPTSIEDPGHTDHPLPAILAFSGVAVASGSVPAWDQATATCSNVYCHGAKLSTGSLTAPQWTNVNGSQAACGTCHGIPPISPSHPDKSWEKCDWCHANTVGRDANNNLIFVNRDLHGNGTVDVAAGACNSCHGGTNNAPPRDTEGSSATTSIGVGAHQTHLSGGVSGRPVACEECHKVPQDWQAQGHIDTSPAEVAFSGVAAADGAAPLWNRTTATCTNVYCHGVSLPGGTNKSPEWTTVNGSQASCGSCHVLPPPPPHVANTACELCHTATAGPNHTIIDRTKHINGVVDIPNGPCNTCHGDATSYAPPKDLSGHTATTFPGVGAHRRHMDTGLMQFAKPFTCDTCHPVPPASTTHMNGTRDLVFSGIAKGTVAASPIKHVSNPAYNSTTNTCSQVYCHGDWQESAHSSGGYASQPVWIKVDGTQVNCGSCHAIPPPAPHPAPSACNNCHSNMNSSMQFIDPAKHVNGIVDF